MYVDLDTCQMGKKQVEMDVQTLKTELGRLGGEKLAYFEQLKQLMRENESHVRELQVHAKLSGEQGLKIEKLKSEKDALNKECIETKMRAIREKEELAKHVEQIEKEIVRREKEFYTRQYEQLLVQSCEAVVADEQRKHATLVEQIKNKYKKKICSR